MEKKGAIGAMILAAMISIAAVSVPVQVEAEINKQPAFQTIDSVVSTIELPPIAPPSWLRKEIASNKAIVPIHNKRHGADSQVTVQYQVDTRGMTSSTLMQFKLLANETLNDARGWARMNIEFVEVPSGGSFTLILSEASQIPTFSTGCSVNYSCRVESSVIINDNRWSGATKPWNNAGGSIRDYRHMVINHEVGHWLGHGHVGCSSVGAVAPIMLQQSIDIAECTFNPWPLKSELTSAELGI